MTYEQTDQKVVKSIEIAAETISSCLLQSSKVSAAGVKYVRSFNEFELKRSANSIYTRSQLFKINTATRELSSPKLVRFY